MTDKFPRYCFPRRDEIIRILDKRDFLLKNFYLRLTLAGAASFDKTDTGEENISHVYQVLSWNRSERRVN